MRFAQIISLLLLFLDAAHSVESRKYTRDVKFDALQVAFKDIQAIANQVNRVIPTAASCGAVKLQLAREGFSVVVTSPFDVTGIPDEITEATIEFYCLDGPIEQVRLDLRDYRRSLQITGSDIESVNAAVATISAKIRPFETSWQGPGFRFWASLLAYGFILILLNSPFLVEYRNNAPPVLIALFLLLALFTLPWTKWLPGFMAFSESAPFYVRHASLISLGSAFLTAVSTGVAIIQLGRNKGGSVDMGSHDKRSARDELL